MSHKRKKCVGMYNDRLLRTIWHFIIKLYIHLPKAPAIPFVCIYAREKKTTHKKGITRIFMAVLFIIAPNWKQPKWINKLLFTHMTEKFSTIRIY